MSVVNYTAEEVKRKLDAGEAVLIDVREPHEFMNERIPGALLFPLSTFDPKALPEDGAKEVILHCGIGQRSNMAGMAALEDDRPAIAHLATGLKGWKFAGYPTIKTDPATGKPYLEQA
ncbi:MAG: rhodanese-like domain-containing protein [Alphaproteobacteria bacterium]|nr:rhodanese-like domain-containing protein [Alphaproteobacteria bacterium]